MHKLFMSHKYFMFVFRSHTQDTLFYMQILKNLRKCGISNTSNVLENTWILL